MEMIVGVINKKGPLEGEAFFIQLFSIDQNAFFGSSPFAFARFC